MINTPQYIKDIYDILSTEHSVKCYQHETEEYTHEDIFNVDGYVVVLDRADCDTLSEKSLDIIVQEIKNMVDRIKNGNLDSV